MSQLSQVSPSISRVWSGRGTPEGFKTHIEEWAFAQLSSHNPASSKWEFMMVTFLSGWLATATQSWPPQDPLGEVPDILKNPNLFSKRHQKQSCTFSQKDCLSWAWDRRLTWPWVYKLTSNWHKHGERPKLWLWSGQHSCSGPSRRLQDILLPMLKERYSILFFFFFFSTVHFVICTESFLVSFISLKVDLFPVSFELNWHKVTPYIYMFKLCNIYNCVLSFFFLIFFWAFFKMSNLTWLFPILKNHIFCWIDISHFLFYFILFCLSFNFSFILRFIS